MRFDTGNIIASLDYDKGISLTMTRRTTVSFGFGTGVAQQKRLAEDTGTSRSRLFLTGQASLLHQMGRTWTTEVGYTRGLRLVDGFAEPVLTDSLFASVGGLLSRRIDVGAFTRYGHGSRVSSPESASFDTLQTTAQIRFALNRQVSMFSQVYYNLYESRGRQRVLPVFLPDYLSRVGVRVGLSLSTSLLN